jgi:hypothetical protein
MKYQLKNRPTPLIVDAWHYEGHAAEDWPDWLLPYRVEATPEEDETAASEPVVMVRRADGEVLEVLPGRWVVLYPDGRLEVRPPADTIGVYPGFCFEAAFEPAG